MGKGLLWSEDMDSVYGIKSYYKDTKDFIEAVKQDYEDGECDVVDVKIEPCICTEKGIPGDTIAPLAATDIIIENYYTARVKANEDNYIGNVIEWSEDLLSEDDFVIMLGENKLNKIKIDLNKNPHILSAGEAGSGNSFLLRLCLWQCALKGAKIYMVDLKGGIEFGEKYERLGEVVTVRDRVAQILTELVEENAARLTLFRDLEVKNLSEYNNIAEKRGLKKLCRIAVFIDEMDVMMDKSELSKEEKEKIATIEQRLSTLVRLSRVTGINLFIGIQRPDAKILTGQIKNNIPVKICGRYADMQISEIVLGTTSDINLPKIKGRFLIKIGSDIQEFQTYYFDDETMFREIEREIKDKDGMISQDEI